MKKQTLLFLAISIIGSTSLHAKTFTYICQDGTQGSSNGDQKAAQKIADCTGEFAKKAGEKPKSHCNPKHPNVCGIKEIKVSP